MSRRFADILIFFSVIVALAILGGLVWANLVYVRSQPVEKEFLVPWLGARTFLQYGESPYNKPATQRAQIVYYGHLATAEQDPLILWLPFPAELFYFPFALITDYAFARAIWMACLEIALVALAILSLRLFEWRPPRALIPVVILFCLFWVYGAISLFMGSASGFIALALVGFLLAFRAGHDELAGGLFVLIAAVPSLTGMVVFFFLWWIIFRRRWRILGGALMALVFFLALSFLFIPDWFIPFLRGWISHITHDTALSSVRIFASWSPVVGFRLGWVLAGLFLLLLSVEWGAAMRDRPRHVLWTICLSVVVMPLMGIPVATTNYIILFIPLMLLMGILAMGKSGRRNWGSPVFLLFGLFIGLWALMAILTLTHAQTALSQVLFLFLPLMILPGLYWVRWRFTRSAESELGIIK